MRPDFGGDKLNIADAIDSVNALVKNTIDIDMKMRWLAQLDGLIYTDIFCTHKDSDGNILSPEDSSWKSYVFNYLSPSEDIVIPMHEDNLFIEFPYDDIYIHYLLMKIYLAVQETARANNEKTEYDEIFERYTNYINRHYLYNNSVDITLGSKYYV